MGIPKNAYTTIVMEWIYKKKNISSELSYVSNNIQKPWKTQKTMRNNLLNDIFWKC